MTHFSAFLKRLLLCLLLLVLILPAVQTRFPIFKMGSLGGYTERASRPDFNWPSLFDNSYQPALEKYVEDRIGFRELLIRLRNQLAYSFFSVVKAHKILLGDDHIALDENFIRGYLGQDFKGESEVRANVRKFKAVQDTLARRGILLVFAIAPNKTYFYAEKQPAYFRQQPHLKSNYTAYAQEMHRKGVNLVDLAQIFQQWKDTASYPLFPHGGVHWSGYGITLAADTLFRYIEQRGRFDLPDHAAVSRTITNEPSGTDNDAAKTMNLIWEPTAFEMAYPDIKFELPKPNQQKPNMLIVGDSFVWSLIGFYPYIQNLFSDKTQFWYYNTQVQYGTRDDMSPGREVALLDRKAEILAQDVVLILVNQYNLGSFDNGFTTNAYDLLCSYTTTDLSRIQTIEQELKQSTAVQDTLWKQAHATNRDYNQLLHEMAIEQYELRHP
ncbi:MAG: hypothetical protein H7Z21_04990 [Hymenobacter sp.]|nr:hypothetical protein [Hymenobacter sp.]